MNYNYKFKLSELDCANCARKIEEKLNKSEYINSASVNFNKLTIAINANTNKDVKRIVSDIVKSVENDVIVLDENEKMNNNIKFDILRIFLGIVLFIISLFIKQYLINELLVIISYILLLYRVVKKALLMLLKSFSIDENLLITISCIGAYFTNHHHEGLMVIILYEIGKILEGIAVNNSRKSITDLMNIKPDYANMKKEDKIIKVNPEDVKINDLIIVKSGEKIPLDGIVIDGSAKLDNMALTGESKLTDVTKNDEVLSGSINTNGLITIKVTKTYENSTVSQILSLVENATDKKAKTENFVAKFAKIYTPIILVLAILIILILPLISNVSLSTSLYRALVFLVISCPCAIAISIPLSYFTGIGASSKEGILIKGSDFLESFEQVKEIIFDKTGTITNGNYLEYNLKILDNNYTKEDVIKYYVSGEILSNHPIAKSIVNLFSDIKTYKITDFKEISGKGITYKLKNNVIKIGSNKFCDSNEKDKAIYLSIDNNIIAKLEILDGIKDNAKKIVTILKDMEINVKMFTGDNREEALEIGEKVGIKDVYYELLPTDKFNLLEKEIEKYQGNVAFVGDGINDAPALKIAKVGISMGGIGSESAIEASDIVIMNDNLDSLVTLRKISKKTNKIIKQNLLFAIGVKILVLLLSALGISTMWQAVFADTGVTLLTILNTTRILKK